MFNAPFADGRGRSGAYYTPPPNLFFRQEQPGQAVSLAAPPIESIRQGGSPAGYWLARSWTGAQQDALNLYSSGRAEKTDLNPPARQHSEAFVKQRQHIRAQFEKGQFEKSQLEKKAAEAPKKTGAEAKSSPPQEKNAGLKPDSKQERPVKSDPKPKVRQASEQPQNKQEGWFKGSASTLIGTFKVGSALIITGGINAFLFGVPLKTAALVSGLVASSQSLTALKIHRENNEFSKKLIGFTRKLMGRENDHTPSGKEWSMVPVWAGVCGMFGLTEAFGNHMYTKITKTPPKTLTQRFDALTEEVRELDKKNVTGASARFRKFQLRTMERGIAFIEIAEKKANEYAKQEGKTWLKTGGELAVKALAKAKHFSENSAGGRNPLLGYIWSFTMASLGGAAQTVIAALMQTRVDKAHGLK